MTMWKKIAPMLIILSVALNLAFVGVWAAHAARGRWFRHEPCRPGTAHSEIYCPLHRRLGTSPEQWKRIEPRLAEFRRASQEVCADVMRRRAEMIDLVAAPKPDREAIKAKQEEILAGQHKMQQLVIDHLLAEKDVLTPEQQRELFDLLRQRSGCAGQMPTMGLQPDVSEPGDTTYSGAAPGHHDNQ
jgi:Spy/CpxP family protein refolding chaperone